MFKLHTWLLDFTPDFEAFRVDLFLPEFFSFFSYFTGKKIVSIIQASFTILKLFSGLITKVIKIPNTNVTCVISYSTRD